jgi:uncharacterized protein
MSYSYLNMVHDVLKVSSKPFTYQEIWQDAHEKCLTANLESTGKTPWQSLCARLYVEVRDNADSEIIKVGTRPARVFLKKRQSELSPDVAINLEKEESKKSEKKVEYHERDLHPLLTYFAYSNPSFNRGRSIFTKTVMSRFNCNEFENQGFRGAFDSRDVFGVDCSRDAVLSQTVA